jgi:hypothetical protein
MTRIGRIFTDQKQNTFFPDKSKNLLIRKNPPDPRHLRSNLLTPKFQ